MTAITMTNDMIAARMAKVGSIHPATRLKCVEIIKAAAAAGHDIWYTWGMGGGEHSNGTALDLMVRNAAAGDWVRNYIWANRARLRLKHVIWEQHITSTVTQPGVRRFMSDRGNTTANHYDHNHVLFLDAVAYVPPPAPVAVKPAAYVPPKPVATTRWTRNDVVAFQKILEAVADGKWGPGTETRAQAFRAVAADAIKHNVVQLKLTQGIVDVRVDGSFGPATRAAVATNTKFIQRVLKVTQDGNWGPGTDRAYVAFHKEWRGK